MALHPEQRKHHLPEEAPVVEDPIRWDLEENEDWHRDLVEHSQDLLCVHDLEGRLLSVNPVPARLLGYSVEEMLRMWLQDVIDPQFRDLCDAYLGEIERTGESRGLMAVMTRSGEQRILEYHSTLRTEGVATPIVQGIGRDVTERVRAEQALRASNEKLLGTVREQERTLHELTLFRTLLDQSNDAIEVIDPETMRFLDVNERACAELGYSREELLSMTVFDIDPNIDEGRRAWVRQQVRESGFAIVERVHRRKDGTTFPVEVNFRRVQLDREYVVAVTRDITARKRAEEALRETNEELLKTARERERTLHELTLFRTLLDQSNDAIQVVDPETLRFLDVNERACVELGYSREELLSMTVFDIDPNINEDWRAFMRQQMQESEFAIMERVHRRKDGTTFPVEVNSRRVRLDRDYRVGVVRNITERKRAEEALRESELRYRTVYERSPIGIALVDSRTGQILQVNPKSCEIAGRSEEELLGIDARSITHPDDAGQTSEYLQQLAEEEVASYGTDKRYVHPDGSVRWARVLAVPMWGKGETRRWHMGLIQDITEQKQAEEAIATLVQVRADSSENFFHSMAGQLAKCLEADYTMIGELIEGEECKVRTIGVCDHGVIAENFTYDLAHTPSETVMRQGACSHVAGVSGMFPKDVWLKQMKMEGYAGTPLRDSQGRVIGVMVALYTRPLANAKFAEIILQLFSTRTAAEIERKRAEEALRQSEERFRVAIRNSPITVFNLDRDLRYTWMYNPQLPGRMSDHLGRTQGEFYSPEDAERITEIRRRVLETGVGTRHETQIVDSGRTHYFDTTIEPVLDAAGKVIGITGAATDVTALREATEALREAKRKLTEEKLYLEQEIHTELGFAEIIGQSKALQAVMEQVGKVAGSDATVLLLGETGTGKELVARAIHRLSQRANNSFIKMNCAAIPSGLLESELFGNEKGAFTGAVSKKIGRIELADKGTLFLDEIGEISLALQPKLLRVLQDQEFERLGGTHTLKVDFRLIAATNRNLADVVRQHEFRSDLYYRLNVFPIRVPPLRERRDDIRLLVEHFVQKCARRMNKSITSIPKRTMDALMGWEWPGNVRELENFIERSVILTQGSVLVSPLSELKPISTTAEEKAVDESLEAAEREHILRALRESHGQIGGLKGAAMRLGLKRTTLQSKLKHFGIDPRSKPPEQ